MFNAYSRNYRRLVFLMPMFLLLFTLPAWAGTITVSNTNDSGAGSLRQAIDDADPGDVINFSLADPSTITIATHLYINKSLTIQGPGASQLTIEMTGTDSVFEILSPVGPSINVTVNDLTVTGGNSTSGNGGGFYVMGDLTLNRCTVSNNRALGGGGIYIYRGSLTAVDSSITNNTATGMSDGGGIYIRDEGAMSLDNVNVTGNQALDSTACGGGIFISYPGTVTIENSTISSNTVGQSGGGIYYRTIDSNSSKLVMTDCTVSDNVATDTSGGGIYVSGPGLEMTGCQVSGNTADDYGGGLYVNPTSPAYASLTDSSFINNATNKYSGGGAYLLGASNVNDCLFQSNTTAGFGGGLYGRGTIVNCTFQSNTALGKGGGIYQTGQMDMEGCLVYGNHSGELGGGLYGKSPGEIRNSTFHGNTADGSGGGGLAFYNISAADPFELSFVTITGNIGDHDCTTNGGPDCESDPGGGIHIDTASVVLKSCVLAENRDSRYNLQIQWYSDLSAGTFTSAGYNCISRKGAGTTGFTNGVNNDQVGGLSPIYPLLKDLGQYGGPTQTRPPKPGSPLLNNGGPATDANGAAVTTDQRGLPRPKGRAADIGAVEQAVGGSGAALNLLLSE